MLLSRLAREIERSSGFSRFQFGFRKVYSTVGAVKRVMMIVEEATGGTWRTRSIPVVILLVVKNAFNSLPWGWVLEALVRRGKSPYLIRQK